MQNRKATNVNFISISIAVGFLVQVYACTDSEQPDLIGFLYSREIPVVTGIHVTTETMPDGTGEVIGTPAYDVSPGSVNAFPNPLIEPDTITRFVYYPTNIIFNRLLPGSTVVVVNARWNWERSGTETPFNGATLSARGARLVRKLLKTDNTQYLAWDLTDERRIPVPAGVYRAYYFGDSIDGVNFIDIAVKRGYRSFINY